MEVIDYFNGLICGKRGNIIYFTRNGKLHVKRYAIPGKRRKWEVEGRTPKQREISIRFAAVQSFYKEYMKQVSPIVWRTAATAQGKIAPN